MLVVSDIDDVIMPSPEDLLVNLQDSRGVVDALLDSLPAMFQVTTYLQLHNTHSDTQHTRSRAHSALYIDIYNI
jgi:hypothetical protein